MTTTGPDDLLAAFCRAFRGTGRPIAADFLAGFPDAPPARSLAARTLPVVRHAGRAAAIADGSTAALARCFAAAADGLPWAQSYGADDFGAAFLDAYGWVELVGPRGLFDADAMSGGFLLLGPGTLYPTHRHRAEELYLPLTGGSLWAAGDAAFAPRFAGDIVHHAPDVPHAMRTLTEPLLAAYLWRGGDLRQTPEHSTPSKEAARWPNRPQR